MLEYLSCLVCVCVVIIFTVCETARKKRENISCTRCCTVARIRTASRPFFGVGWELWESKLSRRCNTIAFLKGFSLSPHLALSLSLSLFILFLLSSQQKRLKEQQRRYDGEKESRNRIRNSASVAGRAFACDVAKRFLLPFSLTDVRKRS